MKKIKLLAPIIGASVVASTIAPLTMLTSCSKTEYNKVYFTKGQTMNRTVSPTTKQVTFKFTQENILYPEELKIRVTNLKVNNIDVSNRSKTFMANIDSAGNIALRVNLANVTATWSNVSTFSFDLVFINKKANTRRQYGTFTIAFDKGSEIEIDTSTSTNVNFALLNGNPTTSTPCLYKLTPAENCFLPTALTITNGSTNEALVNGQDYAYDRDADGKTANLYIAKPIDGLVIKADAVQAATNPYAKSSHLCCDGDWTWTSNPDAINAQGALSVEINKRILFKKDLTASDDGSMTDLLKIYDVTEPTKETPTFSFQTSEGMKGAGPTDSYYYFSFPSDTTYGHTYIVSWTDSYENATSVEQSFVIETVQSESGSSTKEEYEIKEETKEEKDDDDGGTEMEEKA